MENWGPWEDGVVAEKAEHEDWGGLDRVVLFWTRNNPAHNSHLVFCISVYLPVKWNHWHLPIGPPWTIDRTLYKFRNSVTSQI